MARVQVGGLGFDVDVVVFDKDGTLIDFHAMWGRRAVVAVDAVLANLGSLGKNDPLQRALYQALGYDPVSGATDGNGPLAIVPLHKTDIVMSTVLYQHGLPWDEAERTIRDSFSPVMSAAPTSEFVRPLGDVRATLRRLADAGLQTVIATSDNRDITLKMLDMLDVRHHFDLIYCGDDAAGPKKPSPKLMLDIAAHYAVHPARLMMVGDTVSDLSMAHAAKIGARIGVSGGATPDSALTTWSDALIASIEEIVAG